MFSSTSSNREIAEMMRQNMLMKAIKTKSIIECGDGCGKRRKRSGMRR